MSGLWSWMDSADCGVVCGKFNIILLGLVTFLNKVSSTYVLFDTRFYFRGLMCIYQINIILSYCLPFDNKESVTT